MCKAFTVSGQAEIEALTPPLRFFLNAVQRTHMRATHNSNPVMGDCVPAARPDRSIGSRPHHSLRARATRERTGAGIALLQRNAQRRRGADTRVSVFSQENSPFRAIEQVASRIGSDLVVVGTSRFPLFKRVFLGSVSHEVLRVIRHDVLIISPVAARRAHRRSWVASRRLAIGAGNAPIRNTHRVLGARDTT